jgi:ABC-2 type transport system ATP-binding protein
MTSNPLISAENISRSFGKNIAVDRLSLTLHRGEILALLGPNGAGKSTTIRLLTGLLSPSEGALKIAGLDFSRSPNEAKSTIGYLPENAPLYDYQTVEEYLSFCAKLKRLQKQKINSAIDSVLEKCDLGSVKKRRIGHLSTGFRQRVGIAQAIIHNPDIIILDEPANGLDPTQIIAMRSLIATLGEEHGVIFSSHILSDVEAISNQVLILKEGKSHFYDSLKNLQRKFSSECVTACFESSPDMHHFNLVSDIISAKSENNTLSFQSHSPKAVAQQIIKLSVENNWSLYDVHVEKTSLSRIFQQFTQEATTPS